MCYSQREFTVRLKSGEVRTFLCPCGKCIECQKSISSQWAVRCLMEAEYYRLTYNRPSCVVTLTYRENPVSVLKSDFQKFVKRLRSRLSYLGDDVGFTYYSSGEYGSLSSRPHYHCCIFGWCPEDLTFWKTSGKGSLQYRSALLEDLWPFGYVTVGKMSKQTAFYTAKYLQKYIFDALDDADLSPPFTLMSRKPMLGLRYLIEYSFVDNRGKFFFQGEYHSLPRTFYKYLTEDQVDVIMTFRYGRNKKLLDEFRALPMSQEQWVSCERKIQQERRYENEIQQRKATLSIEQGNQNS